MEQSTLMEAKRIRRIGNLEGALRIADAEIERIGEHSNSTDVWRFRFLRAGVLEDQGRFEEALCWLESQPAPALDDGQSRAPLLMHRGICCAYLSRHKISHRLLSEAETAARNSGLPRLIGDIRLFRAFIFYRERNYVSSSKLYRSVLDLPEAENDWYLRGHGLWGMGKNLMIQEQYEDAVHWLVRSLEIFESENARLAMALVWSELGVCYLGLGEDVKALGLFRKSEVVDVECGLLHGYQVDLANIGNVYLHRRDYLTALSYYQRAVSLAREIKDPLSVKKWTYNINLTYARMRAEIDQQHPRPNA